MTKLGYMSMLSVKVQICLNIIAISQNEIKWISTKTNKQNNEIHRLECTDNGVEQRKLGLESRFTCELSASRLFLDLSDASVDLMTCEGRHSLSSI